MAIAGGEVRAPAEPTRTTGPKDGAIRDASWFSALRQLSGIASLSAAAVRALVVPPYAWWRDFVEECWIIARRCTIPVSVSVFFFVAATVIVTGGTLLKLLGAEARIATGSSVGTVRETGVVVTGMVVAGVAGTAICADLGARKVREELDAMRVIGLDPVRKLAAPRILALMTMTPLLTMFGALAALPSGLVFANLLLNVESASFFANFTVLHHIDLLATVVKAAAFGFITAIVACYAGLNATGGSQGVGRAVNSSIVVIFLAIFVFNFAYNATVFATFPELQDLR